MALNLSPNQQLFATTLSKSTGLPVDLVAAWMINEEPQGANAIVGQNNQDWLNVANTNSGFKGATNPWSNPVTAAQDTANWMEGKWADPGYGYASQPIQQIVPDYTKGGVDAAIKAIQYNGKGGWSTGGETALPSLYAQESGTKIPGGGSGSISPTGASVVTAASTQPTTSTPASTGPKASDALTLFGTEDATKNPNQAATWNALGSLLKSKGQ